MGRPAMLVMRSVAALSPRSFSSRRSFSGSRSTPRFLISSWPMLRAAQMLGELASAERQYVVDFEAGERGVGDWRVASEIGWAGARAREIVFGGEDAFSGRRGRRGRCRRRIGRGCGDGIG